MENILYFDACAIFITIVFIISIIVRKNFSGRSNYLMFSMIILILFASIGDLGAGLIQRYDITLKVHRILYYIFSDIYFLCHNHILPTYVFFIYSSIGVWHMFDNKKYLTLTWTVVSVINIILVIFNHFIPVIYYLDEAGNYVRGSLIWFFYFSAAFFGAWGILTIVYYRKLVRSDKMIVLLFLYPIIIASIILQFIWPYMLCEMFAISICLMVFMIVVQSSDSAVDPNIGAKKFGSGIEHLNNILITRRPASIILIKLTNNSNILMYLGQDIYNHFLFRFSTKLKDMAKRTRFSGELFYLEYGLYGFLADSESIDHAIPLAEEIKEYCLKKHNFEGFDVMMDARICLISCPEDFDEFQSLFNFATAFQRILPNTKDILLFSKYKKERDFIIRRDLDSILAKAIENKSFEMYYQPIYSTIEKRFVCAEALIRLKDEKYGYISPKLFIPVAEANGAIHELSDYVLNDVMRFMSEVNIVTLGLRYIEINLSANQSIEANLVDKIETLLDKYGIAPEQISLELTETAADIDPSIVDANVRRLHNLGIRFALDDYGTGYSNIKRVTSLPFDQVKLDKSFVDEIEDSKMWIVMQDTISMLKEMGKEVLVEGVESEEIAQKFIELNCDLLQGCEFMQGFYFCKPLPEKAFIDFMKNKKIGF